MKEEEEEESKLKLVSTHHILTSSFLLPSTSFQRGGKSLTNTKTGRGRTRRSALHVLVAAALERLAADSPRRN